MLQAIFFINDVVGRKYNNKDFTIATKSYFFPKKNTIYVNVHSQIGYSIFAKIVAKRKLTI